MRGYPVASSWRLDVTVGATAGLVSGLVLLIFTLGQGVMATGFLTLTPSGGLGQHLGLAILLGATFGAIFRYQPGSYAATFSGGLLFGLLWWTIASLTIKPLAAGRAPTWSIEVASEAFPELIGDLFYGGMTGLAFYVAITLYLRASPRPEPAPAPTQGPLKRVLVLGGGFGGVSAAQRLEQLFAHDPELEITLVSSSNYLLFTPMLAEVASSALDAQHISAPLRASCPHTRFHRAEVASIDTSQQKMSLRADSTTPTGALSYDHLILALGAVPNYFGLPGMEANSFALKTLHDATLLRNHVIGLLERADVELGEEERRRQLTFVVAGGGFAGTEVIAELYELVRSALRYYPNIEVGDLHFVLVHARDRILPEIGPELADYALKKLRARGIDFLLDTRVSGATSECIILGDDTRLPTRTVVWTAGNRPNQLLGELPFERNSAGALLVDTSLRVRGSKNVWAVGDCARVPDPDNEEKAYPPTAQHALREGKTVADNVAAALRGESPRPFRFESIGQLVALGHRTAVAEIRGRQFSGVLAWLLWRGVYLGKLPGLEKKVRVLLDWMIDLFFPRDTVLTSSASTPTLSETIGDDVEERTL